MEPFWGKEASCLLHHLHFSYSPRQSSPGNDWYQMISGYGRGTVRMINYHKHFLIIIGDFRLKYDFERLAYIFRDFIDISWEPPHLAPRLGSWMGAPGQSAVTCRFISHKTAYLFFAAEKPFRFIKILISKEYFDAFISGRYDICPPDSHCLLIPQPSSPELCLFLQQIHDCPTECAVRDMYIENKITEILTFVTPKYNQAGTPYHIPVHLDSDDKQALVRVLALMKKNPAAYIPITRLAKEAHMSPSRFQMAFRQVYGSTVYKYLKLMRMRYALLLLQNSSDSIKAIAQKVGYHNAGHFSKIFFNIYGIKPSEYRLLHKTT